MAYYKSVRLDRTSHYDKSTLWRVSARVEVDRPDLPDTGPCGAGIHCSPTLLGAVSYQLGPSRYYEVEPEIVIAHDETKARCNAVRVVREIGRDEQDDLAGFRLWEANHPHHPFECPTLRRSDQWIEARVREWGSVRDRVWDRFWDSVWGSVWDSARGSVRASVWGSVRDRVWDSVRGSVRASVWDRAWDSALGYTGSLFTGITGWCHLPGISDPWRPIRRLWLAGYVPSFDGRVWRVHAGADAGVVLSIDDVKGEA